MEGYVKAYESTNNTKSKSRRGSLVKDLELARSLMLLGFPSWKDLEPGKQLLKIGNYL